MAIVNIEKSKKKDEGFSPGKNLFKSEKEEVVSEMD